jgi:hypothetical protein
MQAYGSDRVRPGEGEQLVLLSRFPKAWVPRTVKTLTSAEFPGTAVLWDEQYFEVVAAEGLPQGGVQYVLEPWREMHIMRTTDQYDASSEEARLVEYRAQLSRETRRRSANALAIFSGHLPASVQEEMGRDLGIAPARLTMYSALPVYGVVIALVLWMVSRLIAQTPPPFPLVVLTGYLFAESSFRFFTGWVGGRPIGSPLGLFLYIVYWFTIADRSRATSPFKRERGSGVPIPEAPAERVVTDALMMREPLVTLLDPADQERVAARFGYDYRHQSSLIAMLILAFALLGVATSVHRGAVISFLMAAGISGEQIYRLVALRRGPVGSVLGIVARPFVRKLL